MEAILSPINIGSVFAYIFDVLYKMSSTENLNYFK